MKKIELESRRGFLETFFSAGALVLGAPVLSAQAPGAAEAAWHPSVYLGIETDGTVIIVAHRSEMGQGVRTALPMVVADELDADWKRVRIEQAVADPKFGSQTTDGSTSIRDFYGPMREAGATARLMLERAAAAKWEVAPSECRSDNHQVKHAPSGRKFGYGELTALAAKQPVPKKEELRFKAPEEFRYIGKGVPMVDRDAICAGRATFGNDVTVSGMVYAVVERPPVFGGTLRAYDDRDARKVPGVQQTVVIDGFKPPYGFQALGGVAVIADNTWAAMQGQKKLKVNWNLGENADFDSEAYKRSLFETVRRPQKAVRNVGDVDAEFARAKKTHEAEYYTPLLAHASIEPPVAVAEYGNGKVAVWAPTQYPQDTRETVAGALGIKKEDVVCHVTLLGGAFGRKCMPDYVAEAAILSKKVGKPVKVVWSREEDIRFDYYHSAAAMYLKAATDANGRPTAWLQRSAFPTIGSMLDASAVYGQDYEMGMGWVDLPYDIPNFRAENGPAKSHVRIGWLRSVANIYNAFSVHSFADELAHAAGRDPVDYLLDLLGKPRKIDVNAQGTKYWNYEKSFAEFPLDIGRLRRVIELAAEKSSWGKKKPAKGHGLGIAAHRSVLTYVAAVVEVEVDDNGQVRIPEVHYAVDAGRVIHPDLVRAQFEGAAVFGASIALLDEVTAANGRIQQSNFHDYPVARILDAPYRTHVHIVPSQDRPTGVGEPGVPPIAPAICNAFFVATGKRIP